MSPSTLSKTTGSTLFVRDRTEHIFAADTTEMKMCGWHTHVLMHSDVSSGVFSCWAKGTTSKLHLHHFLSVFMYFRVSEATLWAGLCPRGQSTWESSCCRKLVLCFQCVNPLSPMFNRVLLRVAPSPFRYMTSHCQFQSYWRLATNLVGGHLLPVPPVGSSPMSLMFRHPVDAH